MATTDVTPVDPSNVEALQAWNGDDGDYWTEHETTFDGSVAAYHQAFLDAAAIAPRDAVLDIGCGTGQTTRDAARAAHQGSALGVDLSAQMLGRARQRAADEGLGNVRFLQADAQVHPFDAAAFDVAVSRTGAMFFGDPVAAFTNIGRALRPGGRIVLLVWRSPDENHWFRDFAVALAAGRDLPSPPPGAPGPFSLADPDRARAVLGAAGFVDVAFDGAAAPMWFGDSAAEAFRFVRGLGFTDFLLRDLDDVARARALDDLRATIDAHETDDGVRYPSATWLITARRP